MKKLLITGAVSLLTLTSITAKELRFNNLSSNWKGALKDFKVVEGKGIGEKAGISFRAKKKYKTLHYRKKINVPEGKKLTYSVDFKADIESGSSNKVFISLYIAPNPYKADGRVNFGVANSKKGFLTLGNIPRWTNKGLMPSLLGMPSSTGETPWMRLVITLENQGKKIAAKGTIYSLGEDGTEEPKLIKETKLKKKTKKGDWLDTDKLSISLASVDYQAANLNELIVSKIDVKVDDL